MTSPSHVLQVPLTAFVKLIPPVARGDFKVTLDAGARGPPAPLTDVFAEVVARALPGTTAPSILTFQMLHSGHVVRQGGVGGTCCCSPSGVWKKRALLPRPWSLLGLYHDIKQHNVRQVSVLLSSQSGRYRLQSDVFSALWLPLDALLSAGPPQGAAWGLVEPLPLGDVLAAADTHLQLHRGLHDAYTTIDQQYVGAHQTHAERQKKETLRAPVCAVRHDTRAMLAIKMLMCGHQMCLCVCCCWSRIAWVQRDALPADAAAANCAVQGRHPLPAQAPRPVAGRVPWGAAECRYWYIGIKNHVCEQWCARCHSG